MTTFIKISLFTGLFVATHIYSVSAQSIATNLAKFKKIFGEDLAGIPVSSISGVTFHPTSRTLYMVDDENTTVYEISTSGSLIRYIALSGFDDTEGIAYQSGNYFFITEERLANLLRVPLPATGSGPVSWDGCTVLSLAENWGNSGLEGVAYCASDTTVYAIKELAPPRLYRIALNTNGDPTDFFENDPFNIENINGDAAGIYALSDGTFLIVNQEDNKLIGYSAIGEKLSELSLNMTKPEGITVDESDSTIYVVGEPRQLFIFKNPETSIQPLSPDTPLPGFSYIISNSEVSITSQGKHIINIRNLTGRLVFSYSGEGTKAYNLSGIFGRGIYFVTVIAPKVESTRKIVLF